MCPTMKTARPAAVSVAVTPDPGPAYTYSVTGRSILLVIGAPS